MYIFVPLSLIQEQAFFELGWGPFGGSARGSVCLEMVASFSEVLASLPRHLVEGLSKAHFLDCGKLYALTLPRRSSYSGHASWVPMPQMCKSGLKGYGASRRRRSSGLRQPRGWFAKRSREELAYCLSERRTAMPLAGRQGARARTVLGTGPEGEARRRPRGVLPRRERTGAGESSGQAGGPDGFPGPPDCREGADKTVRLRRGARGPRVNTLRMRIRAWTILQIWLEGTLGKSWPHTLGQ